MYKPIFRKKANGLPILSRDEIESITEVLIKKYNQNILMEPQPLNIELMLEEYFKLNLEFHYLSHNGTYLGRMVFNNEEIVEIYLPKKQNIGILKNIENTVIIDSSLEHNESLLRCTIAHEIGHSYLHDKYYWRDNNQLSLFNKNNNRLKACKRENIVTYNQSNRLLSDKDWLEWQANTFASCILMPKKSIYKLCKCYKRNEIVSAVSKFMNVSKTAAMVRLKILRII